MRKRAELRRRMPAGLAAVYLACVSLAGLAALGNVVWPQATGEQKKSSGSLTVDFSNAQDGYIMVKADKSKKRLKLRIAKGKATLTYDLNSNGEYEVFPLQLGSGKYQCSLFKNASGKKYAQDGKVSINVELENENAAFLCPSQYVNYNEETQAVAISEQICAGLSTDREKFEAVREYMKATFVYDYVKAATVKSGTLPDIEGCYEKKMGICQDLAAFAACMLRVQGVPVKLVVGYAGKSYHAWNSVFIDGEEVFYDPTLEINAIATDQKYTVERYY